jgi:bacterioferritin (cytochrome b1)
LCQESDKCPHGWQCEEYGKIGYFNRELDTLHLELYSYCDDWDAPWVDFARVSVAAYDHADDDPFLLAMLKTRPHISQIFLTTFRIDERMEEKLAMKGKLEKKEGGARWPYLFLLENLNCVGLDELEVAEDQEEGHEDLDEMTGKLMKDVGKEKNIAVEVAFASICCYCP